MATRQSIGEWEGGYVAQSRGRQVYVIRRRIDGRQFEVSTRATTLRAALEHLKRFEANPAAYSPHGIASPLTKGGVRLTDAMIDTRIDQMNAAKATVKWMQNTRRYLRWWQGKLVKRDLRTLTLLDLTALIQGTSARNTKIRVLKKLYSTLRRQGLIDRRDDPTLDLQPDPQRPAQWAGRVRAISLDVFHKTYAKVKNPQIRDALTVMVNTGLHITELRRLTDGHGYVDATTICVIHKAGRQHRIEVEPEVSAAATRLVKAGTLSESTYAHVVTQACKDAGVPKWGPGSLRHTYATLMHEAGVDPAQIASYLGHVAASTTRRFYSSLAKTPRPKVPGVKPTHLSVVD